MSDWKSMFPKDNIYYETDNGILYKGDCLEIMKGFSDESVELLFTSPPYYAGKEYEDKEKTLNGYKKYINFLIKTFSIFSTKIVNGGNIYINIDEINPNNYGKLDLLNGCDEWYINNTENLLIVKYDEDITNEEKILNTLKLL